jgi:hypothetical protein
MEEFNTIRQNLFQLLDEVYQDEKAVAIVNPGIGSSARLSG